MGELVSIIMPCYNSENYLAEAIESVLAQSYVNWELPITDDCSTDNSVEIIKQYVGVDSRIKLYSTIENTGHPSEPRNISIRYSKGAYIAFLDSDDVWFPNKLREQIDYLERNNCELVTSYSEFIDSGGNSLGIISKSKKRADYYDMLKKYQLSSPTIICSAKIKNKLYFPSCKKEDYVAWLSVVKQGVIIHNTQMVHAYYRVSNESRSRNKWSMLIEHWRILRNIEQLNVLMALYYFSCYVFYSLKKYW